MLINLRNALMSGKRLPYDAEVEYITSDGIACLNTGIYYNDSMSSFDIDFELITVKSGNQRIFGWEYSNYVTDRIFIRYASSSSSSLALYYSSPSKTMTATGKVHAHIDLLLNTIEINNSIALNGTSVKSPASLPLGLFGITYPNQLYANFAGKIFGLTITYRDGSMRMLKPVAKDGVGAFYDTQTGLVMFSSTSSSFGLPT